MILITCAVYVFVGALLFALPNMTRRELLFAVPVPSDFRQSRAGRHAIRMFRVVVVIAVLAGIGALLLSPAGVLTFTATAVALAILLAGYAGFYWQNHKLASAAVQYTRRRETELTATPEELPRFAWLAVGPFVILAATARWLFLNWDRIPARFPNHWGANGQPDHWAERTTRGVYGDLFIGVEFCVLGLIWAAACWFGARRSPHRRVWLGCMVACVYSLALLTALDAVQPALGIPSWVNLLAPLAILIPTIVVMIKKWNEPSEPMDATPNECWKGSVIYYNPDDAALFVERRAGFGYTPNFANRWSWTLFLSLALVIASIPFVTG